MPVQAVCLHEGFQSRYQIIMTNDDTCYCIVIFWIIQCFQIEYLIISPRIWTRKTSEKLGKSKNSQFYSPLFLLTSFSSNFLILLLPPMVNTETLVWQLWIFSLEVLDFFVRSLAKNLNAFSCRKSYGLSREFF